MMNRRDFFATAAAAASTMAMAPKRALAAGKEPSAKGHKAAAGSSKRPNLVYVFADQLRYKSCGYAGDEYARTPNIDRLAAQGCNVHQAVSSTPVCSPYRASLMTGKYQSSHGLVINETRLSPEHECFGHALTTAGYKTAYIGKWHMWANQLGHHDLVKNGFVPPGPYRLGFDGFWEAYNFNHMYWHSPYFNDDANPHLRKQYEPNAQTDVAINYLNGAAKNGEPFAMFLSWGPPHSPWGNNCEPEYKDMFANVKVPKSPNYTLEQDTHCDAWQKLPKKFAETIDDDLKTYYAQTANIDWNVGRLMEALDKNGLADNTIFVFTSDHGEMFGSHGRHGKLIFYEEASRIPFLVRWPKKIKAHTVTDALLGTPDIMPTVLSMMDIKTPAAAEGKDLSAALMGGRSDQNEVAHMQGMGATAAWTDGSEWRGVRDNEFTYAVFHSDGEERLYNHRKDPFQMIDLAKDRNFAATLAHYRETSAKWRKQMNDDFGSCTSYQKWTDSDRNIVNTATGVKQDVAGLKKITDRWFPNGIGEKSVSPYPVGGA